MKELFLAAAIGATVFALAACEPTPKAPKAVATSAVMT
jgi:hypothetical protein